MPYPSPTARSRLTFELSRQTGLRRKPKGNISPCIIAVPRWAGDSKRGNRRDAERCQRQEPTGLHRSRQVLCKQSGIAERSRQFSDEVSWMKVDPQAAAAASGEEDITEGGDNQGGNQGGGTTGGELEG